MLRADPKLKNIPVIFLTAKAEESDRILGLETGADDYICKPFSTKELILRIQALLRRSTEGAPEEAKLLQAAHILLGTGHHHATVQRRPAAFTATGFKLPHSIVQHRGLVPPPDQLLL